MNSVNMLLPGLYWSFEAQGDSTFSLQKPVIKKKKMKRVPVEIRKKLQAPGYLWWDVVLKTETNKNVAVS